MHKFHHPSQRRSANCSVVQYSDRGEVRVTKENFTVLPFPRSRQVVVDAGRLGARRPIIYALLEFDVTDARAIMRRHKEESGESLSFTAFIVACLGRAVAADPSVQAYRNWRLLRRSPSLIDCHEGTNRQGNIVGQ